MLNMQNQQEKQSQIENVMDDEPVNHNESETEEEFILHQSPTETKEPLADVQLDEHEAAVFGSIFDENEQSQFEESVIYSPGGTARVKRIIDDDCELIFEVDRVIKPMDMGYQVKICDALSENIPFKENVSIYNTYLHIHFFTKISI